jgi:hypothetical protein
MPDLYQLRFEILFPKDGRPRYLLHAPDIHAPDIHELRWSVWDKTDKKTVAFGLTAEQAADALLYKLGLL